MYNVPKMTLGKTGLVVTRLGIGGAYCDSVDGYRTALDCGVNYIDTARIYREGEDEKVIGEAIQGQREQLILATKTTQRDADSARKDLETSLRLLKTEYIDIYQLHHLNTQIDREKALGPGGAIETVLKAKEEGLIRFIGVTGHDWVQMKEAVITGLFDTVLFWYNCVIRGPEDTVLPEALARNMGVIIMNATRNDKLLNDPEALPPEQFYRYVLSQEAVHITIIGLRNVERFCQVASALSQQDTLTTEEKIQVEAYGEKMLSLGKLD
jgi:aryl-alcohol dehydrogenase-like predicted oxidoreductase